MDIPYLSFDSQNQLIKKEIFSSFKGFFDSKWYILGKNLKKFEQEYALFNNVKHCIGVSNGLDALHLSLKTLDIGEGDEVIVPSNTYIATVLATSFVGAKPVFVEPNLETYNIDVDKIEAAISPNTKAIMPVHLYGQSCEMQKIMEVARKNKLIVIEDNAQSQGSTYYGKFTGSFGDANATSFYPGKNLGALGDAGAVTTNSDDIAKRVLRLRNYGSEIKYYNEEIGFNMRMDECQAGFLSVKLKYLDNWTQQRQAIAAEFDEALKGIGDIVIPKIAKGATHVYHIYMIRTKKRNQLMKHLKEKGIGTLIHYPVPPHLQKAYNHLGFQKGSFPIAEEIAETCLSLPLWPGLDHDKINCIIQSIDSFYANN